MSRRSFSALLLLVLWALAVPFVGPVHHAWHAEADHHDDAADCAECAREAQAGPRVACGIPADECPDPTHHHHPVHRHDDVVCVACATLAAPVPLPPVVAAPVRAVAVVAVAPIAMPRAVPAPGYDARGPPLDA